MNTGSQKSQPTEGSPRISTPQNYQKSLVTEASSCNSASSVGELEHKSSDTENTKNLTTGTERVNKGETSLLKARLNVKNELKKSPSTSKLLEALKTPATRTSSTNVL
jgi:hypothetical protein